jgi:hypothetical protein
VRRENLVAKAGSVEAVRDDRGMQAAETFD